MDVTITLSGHTGMIEVNVKPRKEADYYCYGAVATLAGATFVIEQALLELREEITRDEEE